jgi:seryl-tRNA synthetase
MGIEELVDVLRTERDELRVRLHLMKTEIRDEFEGLEDSWNHLESRLDRLKDASKESADDLGAAAKQLAEELGATYKRIKKSLQ